MSGGGLRLGIRAKLFLISIGLISLCLVVVYLAASAEIERHARDRIRDDLIVRARLVSTAISASTPRSRSVAEWDALADRLGQKAKSRVTLVARDGNVLGDSRVTLEEIAAMDNHAGRPEVASALKGKETETRRFSATMEREMMYVAVPIRAADEVTGVARVSIALTQINSSLDALREALLISAALAFTIALLVTTWTVQVASRTARRLTSSAQRMASGDLHVRIRPEGHDEFADLGRALDLLAKNLSSTLGDLRDERDRLSGILENMREGVLFLDAEGRIALVNPALREMLVLSGDEVGNSLLESVRHAELRSILDGAQVDRPSEGEITIGGLRPSQLLVLATRLEGEHAGVLAVFVDVTETRRLEGIRTEFVANVSHELRTPVTSIRSAAESLQVAWDQPEMAKKFAQIIERNGQRLQVLVEDLLELSRIESRQYSPSLEPIEMSAFVEQVFGLFSERASRSRVELASTVDRGLPRVLADARALEHVLANLVDNGIKYAGVGKTVTVSVVVTETQGRITVSDNGPGIPEKHLPRLFERFYRIDAGRSRDVGGTGLGLSIVKNLTESMNGRVSVASQEGVGTSFTVSLPLAPRVGPEKG